MNNGNNISVHPVWLMGWHRWGNSHTFCTRINDSEPSGIKQSGINWSTSYSKLEQPISSVCFFFFNSLFSITLKHVGRYLRFLWPRFKPLFMIIILSARFFPIIICVLRRWLIHLSHHAINASHISHFDARFAHIVCGYHQNLMADTLRFPAWKMQHCLSS